MVNRYKSLHIKINSTEENKDEGFSAILISGASVICLKDDEYIVNEEVIAKLNSKKVIYEVVPENASKIKI